MKRKENRLAKAARRAQKKLAQRESSANSHNATDVQLPL